MLITVHHWNGTVYRGKVDEWCSDGVRIVLCERTPVFCDFTNVKSIDFF